MSQCEFKILSVSGDGYLQAARNAAELMDKGIFNVVLPHIDQTIANQVAQSSCWSDGEKLLLEHLSKQFA